MLGPLFFWEVLRLARRGRGTALRFLYGGTLLVGLAVLYARHFPGYDLLSMSTSPAAWIGLAEQARFAQSFVTTLLLLQMVAVLALTPAYLAGAIAEERDKKTLTLLLTTALTDREIVVGKMLGRLAHVGSVLLVGLPVLSLAQLWGGVDATFLLAGFAATALTLLSVGAISLFCSVTANSVLSAVVGSYAATALLGLGCLCQGGGFAFSPISFVVELGNRMAGGDAGTPGQPAATAVDMVVYYALVHGTLAVLVTAWAVTQLRPFDQPPLGLQPSDPVVESRRPPKDVPSPTDLAEMLGIYRPSPPVGEDALLWKEALQGSGPAPPTLLNEVGVPAAVGVIALVTIWGAVGLQWLIDPAAWRATDWSAASSNAANPILRMASAALLTVACVGVGFRAAGCVSRERERHTLDALLSLPVTRPAVLRAKWLGSVLRMRQLYYLVFVLWLVGAVTGALYPLALPLVALTAAAHVAFVAGLGVWVSVAMRRTVWANLVMAVLLLLYFGGGWLIWLTVGTPPGRGLDFVDNFCMIGLNPWRSWWALTVPLARPDSLTDEDAEAAALVAAAAGGVYFAALAAGAWLLAVRRFSREPARAARRSSPDHG